MNKQGRVRFWTMFLGLFLAITAFFIIYAVNKPESRTGFIGNIAMEIIAANARGQQALDYIDSSAQVSSDDAAILLLLNGGFVDTPECGTFGGFNLWKTKDTDCTPRNLEPTFLRLMEAALYRHLDYYPQLSIDLDYTLSKTPENTVIGQSSRKLHIPLFKMEADRLGYCRTGQTPVWSPAQTITGGGNNTRSINSYDELKGMWPTPNCQIAENRQIDMIVIHYTAGYDCSSDTETMLNPDRKASAHYLICEDGSIRQLVADRDVAWHAGCYGECDPSGGNCKGECLWYDNVNTRSIGIEIQNPGYLGSDYDFRLTSPTKLIYTSNYGLVRKVVPPGYADPITISSVEIVGQGKLDYEFLDGSGQPPVGTILRSIQHNSWAAYTDKQYDSLSKLTSLLVSKYNIAPQNIIGHEQVVQRKVDPGPAFNWSRLRANINDIPSYDQFLPKVAELKKLDADDQEKYEMLDMGEIMLDATWSARVNADLDILEKINQTIFDLEEECQLDDACWGNRLSDPAFDYEKDFDFVIMHEGKIISKEGGRFETDTWINYCESDNELPLNYLTGFYQYCNNTKGSDCHCTFEKPENEGGIRLPLYAIYDIRGKAVNSDTVSLYLKETSVGARSRLRSQTLDKSGVHFPSKLLIEDDLDYINPDDRLLEIDDGTGHTQDIEFDELVLYRDTSGMHFGRTSGNSIYLADGSAVTSRGECAPSNLYKFCIIDKNRKVFYYDPTIDSTQVRHPVLRMARYLIDTTPPDKLTGVKAYNKEGDEGAIIVEWMNSSAGDFSHYHLYCSETSFSGSVENIYPMYVIYNQTNEEPLKIELTKCGALPIEDQKTYYIAVTPIDTSDNENFEVDEATTSSEDNMPPGLVTVRIDNVPPKESNGFIEFDPSIDTPSISWDYLMENYDGEQITDLVSYLLIYVEQSPNWDPSSMPAVLLSSCSTSTSCDLVIANTNTLDLSLLDPSLKYYIAVLGVDDDNNFLQNLVGPYVDTYIPDTSKHRIEEFVPENLP